MNPFQRLERGKAYSRRSQSSLVKQWQFEADLTRATGFISLVEADILKIEEDIQRIAASVAHGLQVHPTRLQDATRELEDKQRSLAAYKDQRCHLQSEINSLVRLNRSQVSERLKQQIALGRLAAERLEADHRIGRAVDELRRLLNERDEASAKMHGVASAIDLKGDLDFLDEARFNRLLSSLPSNGATASEQWAAWFAGAEQGKKRYVVRLTQLALKEILANANYYTEGDSVWLTKEQASAVLADHPRNDWLPKAIELQETCEVGAKAG